MAFYIVTDGKTNAYGEADTFVVRASGPKQAIRLASPIDTKNATAEKLEDGRGASRGIVLASFAESTDVPTPATDYDSALVESEDEASETNAASEPDDFYGTYSY